MNILKRVFVLFAALVTISLLSTERVQASMTTNQSANFEPQDCWFDDPIPFLPGPEFQCGYVTVPERHENPQGPQITLPVAIARAENGDATASPLFLAQGGPGGDAFEVFSVMLGTSSVWRDRDVVIFNQRGTRYAEPDLSCTESFDATAELLTLPAEEAESRSLELLQACYDRLVAQGVDLSAYNSLQNAADVNLIRKALGYDSYNFYGVSYGTLLGLHLLREQPQGLRSVILDGVVPPNLNFIPRVAANTDRVFKEIIKTCEDNESCRNEYPNLENRFFSLVDELNESPKTVTVKDGESGQRAQARLDGDTLVDVLFQAFYLPDSYAYFPKLVTNLESGDMTFIEGIWPLIAFDRSISEGMYFSVICAEDSDFEESELVLDGVHPYFADGANLDLQSYKDACNIWQVDKLPPEVDDPVSSSIPVLLLSGHYDPITPPYFADVAADSLSNDVHIIDPTGSHGVAFGDLCLDSILSAFLDAPGSDLDTSCLATIEYQSFAPSDAISFPFIGEINQLSDSVGWQLGIATLLLLIVWSCFLVLPLVWLVRVFSRRSGGESSEQGIHLRRVAGLLAIGFGLFALLFVIGAGYFTFESLISGLAAIFAVRSQAAPFFAIPLFLVAIAAVMVVVMVISWRRNYWTAWARVYYSIITLAAVAYVIVLGYSGVLTVLL